MKGPLAPWTAGAPRVPARALVRRFLLFWLPAVAVLAAVSLLLIGQHRDAERRLLESEVDSHLHAAALEAAGELAACDGDLSAVLDLRETRHLLGHDTPEMRDELAGDLVAIDRSIGRYDRLALLDADGREMAAVRLIGDSAAVADAAPARTPDDEALVRAVSAAPPGVTLARPSPAGVDGAPGPTLRLARPLFDDGGARRGALLAVLRASRLLDRVHIELGHRVPQGFALLDASGAPVFGGAPSGGLATLGAPVPLSVARPAEWARVMAAERGAVTLPEGLLRFDTLHPPPPASDAAARAWKLVALLPAGGRGAAGGGSPLLLGLDVLLALLLGVGALQLARATETRRAAEALARARLNLLERLVNTIPNPIFFKDAEGRYRGCNDAFEWFVGRTAEQIMGHTVLEIATGTLASRSNAEDLELLRAPGQLNYEGPLTLPDGGQREVITSKSSFLDAEGRMAGIVGVVVDITDRKQAEGERERLIGELQEALASVKKLSGLLPICASCKKIRDDQGYWQQVEVYVRERSEADFSHGICPDCLARLYPEFGG